MPNNIDWSLLITKAMKEKQEAEAKYLADSATENAWRNARLLVIADQLLAIEDDDPNRMLGTDREWRDYRIALRAWKEGAEGFPNMENRPVAPQE